MPDACVDSVVTDPPYELGFMGKKWDASGIAYSINLWSEVLRVLKPGGHLLAFGGTRTYHRMTCAIEDAGFEIRDSIHWMYGSGFPKSLDVEKNGAGEAWKGWGTALKPAHEPVVMARKPLAGTIVETVLRYGTGAINVDGCRVQTSDNLNGGAYSGTERKRPNYSAVDIAAEAPLTRLRRGIGDFSPPNGRWPANVLLSHSEECGDGCAEGCPVAELDRQSGTSRSSKGKPRGASQPGDGWGMTATGAEYDDAGGASRFFNVFEPDDAAPFVYAAKPSTRERDAGLDALSEKSGHEVCDRQEGSAGANNPRAGVRTSRKNTHPTVKGQSLMRHLCRLVTPPGGVVLDPFAGSGSTLVAAISEGFRCIGIEREEEYVAIVRARVEHALVEAVNAAAKKPNETKKAKGKKLLKSESAPVAKTASVAPTDAGQLGFGDLWTKPASGGC